MATIQSIKRRGRLLAVVLKLRRQREAAAARLLLYARLSGEVPDLNDPKGRRYANTLIDVQARLRELGEQEDGALAALACFDEMHPPDEVATC